MEIKRKNWDKYFLDIAACVSSRSTCLRRKYGAVIVKNNKIVSTGYNGAAIGIENCCDIGKCYREKIGIKHGERYELCKAVHAEMNACINGNPLDLIGATIYIAGIDNKGQKVTADPCKLCDRVIRNAQIACIVYENKDQEIQYIFPFSNT